MGVLYGRYELLDSLTAYKVRPAPKNQPGKFETGTGNFEGIWAYWERWSISNGSGRLLVLSMPSAMQLIAWGEDCD